MCRLEAAAAELNPGARVFATDSDITLDDPGLVQGKRVLLVEDGPTVRAGAAASCRKRQAAWALPPTAASC